MNNKEIDELYKKTFALDILVKIDERLQKEIEMVSAMNLDNWEQEAMRIDKKRTKVLEKVEKIRKEL